MMTISSPQPLPNCGNPKRKILLFSLSEPLARTCQSAASTLSIDSIKVNTLEEASRLSDTLAPTCLVTFDDADALRVLLKPTDRIFRRVVTVIAETKESLVEQYQSASQFAFSTLATQATIQIELDDAIKQAAELQWKWSTIEDFQRRLEQLTPEEIAVLDVVCQGHLNKQIANKMGVSIRTIEQRRRRVFDKMEVESAVPLTAQLATVKALMHPLHRKDTAHRGLQTNPTHPVIDLTSTLSNPAYPSSIR